MPQDHVLSEDDVAPAGAEQKRIQRLSQYQAERAGDVLRQQRHGLMEDERLPPGPSDDERDVFLTRGFPGIEELILRAGNGRHRDVYRVGTADTGSVRSI